MEEDPPTTLLKSSELSLLKKIIRGIALTDKELGWTRRKSRKSLTAVLGINDSRAIVGRDEMKSRKPFRAVLGIQPDETKAERSSWPVADKGLTINEKNICLVVISAPDICSSSSLSNGYPPRPTGPDGFRLTDLQADTIRATFREILFLR